MAPLLTGVATLYFPERNITKYTHQGSVIELIFSDERFNAPIGDTKIIDQILNEPETTLRNGGIQARHQFRKTLTGTGYALELSVNDGKKRNLSPLWRTQVMYTMLRKMGEYGYTFISESNRDNALTFNFKEENNVMDEIFGPR
mmetsp:Transcript_14285/g.17649  ORF Transcript_14285/g.17649 Transcript_14285/m.17649 type:complete len:144 (+) Transcript_14285:287-718(+)|eukprot:CAMPEP_0204834496 /NCGR_PEP_ID=MMETSP1346-20131115/20012_1 /ASSEMBLY_ACC=CAM_ASM_000771 /TAXON_ID=215587 /ORGANISM="Aplanochytrium stocchinoi, Strain GSBS06" /LENGTH=143 /DNA_ID=CAMNT_0051967855 /DNA_START=183 /DNA_END=614 /DNA_ORIENTATION=+